MTYAIGANLNSPFLLIRGDSTSSPTRFGGSEDSFSRGEGSKLQQKCDRAILWYQRNEQIRKFKDKTGLFHCGYKENHLSDWSCSQYTREAIQKYGVIKGIWLGFWRISMCNPITFQVKRLQKYFINP